MKRSVQRNRNENLYKAILQLESLEECMDFFEDICAETELRSMEQRFEVAGMLSQEKVYAEIIRQTNASTATISRVNRALKGGTGMLEKALVRLPETGMKTDGESRKEQ